MPKLILIKHPKPQVVPEVPAHEWGLSAEGRAACSTLADRLAPHEPGMIFTSAEPKAVETGELLAGRLGVPVATAPGLQEHDRSNVAMLPSREFISLMALFFKEPNRLVLGRETARQATARIQDAIQSLLVSRGEENLALVTHGTVLALFAAAHGAGDPFHLWRRMGLPSFMVFTLPELILTTTVDKLDAEVP